METATRLCCWASQLAKTLPEVVMLLALVQKAKRVVGELWPLTKGQENDTNDLQKEEYHDDHEHDNHQPHQDDHHHHFHSETNPNSSPTDKCMDPKSAIVVENVNGLFGGCFYWFLGKKTPVSILQPPLATPTLHAEIPMPMRISHSARDHHDTNNESNQESAVVIPSVDISLVIGRRLMAKLIHLGVRLETRRNKLYQEREATW